MVFKQMTILVQISDFTVTPLQIQESQNYDHQHLRRPVYIYFFNDNDVTAHVNVIMT